MLFDSPTFLLLWPGQAPVPEQPLLFPQRPLIKHYFSSVYLNTTQSPPPLKTLLTLLLLPRDAKIQSSNHMPNLYDMLYVKPNSYVHHLLTPFGFPFYRSGKLMLLAARGLAQGHPANKLAEPIQTQVQLLLCAASLGHPTPLPLHPNRPTLGPQTQRPGSAQDGSERTGLTWTCSPVKGSQTCTAPSQLTTYCGASSWPTKKTLLRCWA